MRSCTRPAVLVIVLALALVGSTPARATPRPARDTADVGPAWSYSVGVFNPLRVAVADRVELEAHPLVFFVAPHLDVRVALLRPPLTPGEPPSGLRLTAVMGLAMPTWGMRLMKGYFFPTWSTSANDIGYMLIPRFGLQLSGNVLVHDVYTFRGELAVRWPLGPNSAAPLDSFLTPLDLLLAAPLTGLLGRVGAAYDHAFGDLLRLRAEANLYVTGQPAKLMVSGVDKGPLAGVSPLVFTAHLGLDIAVFKSSRVTVGVLYSNRDQGASQVVPGADGFSERVRVRSNDFLPTLDFIWAG